jgi:carbon-monoxide dehydrogenase small subunit
MSRVSLSVNGETVTADVEPRTHLADFLREDRLLTATHLGCEHGVCGACTLLINDAPARSCITFAVACESLDIRTIEGLENDPTIVRLRAAFTAEHGLQCGYCTPGMLVTARDIIHRLPDADEARIRLELAGNLCRCTGYAGIVRAIQRVLAEGIPVSIPTPTPLPALQTMQASQQTAPVHTPGRSDISQTLRLAAPIASVWSALRDPNLVVSCVPGARLLELSGERLRGEIRATLGPIDSLFTGEATVSYDDATHRAGIVGEGRDSRTNTRLGARAELHLREVNAGATEAVVAVAYTLRGPLAQIARGSIVQEFAGAIAATFAANLQGRLTGGAVSQQQHLSVASLIMRALWRRLRAILGAN